MHYNKEVGITYRCPKCKAPFGFGKVLDANFCLHCGYKIVLFKGIPLLVKDYGMIEHRIEKAIKSNSVSWYKDHQMKQWEGPYRHHLNKRKIYVENVLSAYGQRSTHRLTGLDLGCGDGSNFFWLRQYFKLFYASDYNLVRLVRAMRIPAITQIFLADVLNYPTVDDSFDLIFFNHVLEHIDDDIGALSEVHRILKPRGLLILGVPNEGAFFWQLAYKLQSQVLSTSDHVHFYTEETISNKCREVGFNLLEISPIGWGLPHWTLDSFVRRFKWVDDLFEVVGRALIPTQATSLYLILEK